MKRLTGIKMGLFPFIYLGCPVLYGRRNAVHFEELLRKITRRVRCWHNKFLSYGGKYILVNNILQSMPLYLLSVMLPSKKLMNQVNHIFSSFFWSKFGGC